MRQVVDTETAKEFMRETLEKVDESELAAICADVEKKSAWFQAKLARDESLGEDDYAQLIRRVFSARRNRKQLTEGFAFTDVKAWIAELLHGDGAPETRFQAFVDRLDGLPDNTKHDFASELLHFTFPDRYWLWTRWLWDPKAKTGALPLVTSAAYDLSGDSAGEIYQKVGKGILFVHEVGEAAGFQSISKSVFGTDVFLCCVYVIYAYTVLKMRMTQEFNKVMPELPEFCRRLLGVYQKGSPRPALS